MIVFLNLDSSQTFQNNSLYITVCFWVVAQTVYTSNFWSGLCFSMPCLWRYGGGGEKRTGSLCVESLCWVLYMYFILTAVLPSRCCYLCFTDWKTEARGSGACPRLHRYYVTALHTASIQMTYTRVISKAVKMLKSRS